MLYNKYSQLLTIERHTFPKSFQAPRLWKLTYLIRGPVFLRVQGCVKR